MDRIHYLEEEIEALKSKLRSKEKELADLKRKQLESENAAESTCQVPSEFNLHHAVKMGGLPKWAIERYSRQILLPDIGVEGQERLCAARVLVVGAGGLGCPAAAYLAGAGVGELGIADGDTVDVTNIHRQILHAEADQNVNKAVSAADTLRKINSRIKITAHQEHLTSLSVMGLLEKYDLVLDCTDNVATRYLLGDACALLKLPLVSGSALKMEGQLSVYSYRAGKNAKEEDTSLVGPCYRCVFPVPPPLEAVGSCSVNGVAGPVPGVIGCLQALEAIKLVAGQSPERLLVGRMLIMDGEDMTFRTVKLRPRNPECKACGPNPNYDELLNYEIFCSARAREENPDLHLLPPSMRITAEELTDQLKALHDSDIDPSTYRQRHLLVDVRSSQEFAMCHIDGAVNYPLDTLHGSKLESLLELVTQCEGQMTFMCRRGNDSQLAAARVVSALPRGLRVRELAGGLRAWALRHRSFPVY